MACVQRLRGPEGRPELDRQPARRTTIWIITKGGFISLVQDRQDREVLHVRARVKEDITEHFPHAEVITIDGADYRFRAYVNRNEVAQVLAQAVLDIDYTGHFKDIMLSTAPEHPERYGAMYDTWSAMARMQEWAPYASGPRLARERWEDWIDQE